MNATKHTVSKQAKIQAHKLFKLTRAGFQAQCRPNIQKAHNTKNNANVHIWMIPEEERTQNYLN